jgi:Ca2+-binding RTX toxin-like protein
LYLEFFMSDIEITAANPEFLVNTLTKNGQYNSRTAALDGGGFIVIWESPGVPVNNESSYDIMGQIFTDAGAKVGGEFVVNTEVFYTQNNGHVTGLAGGGFAVTWDDYSGLGGDDYGPAVKAKLFSATGAVLKDDFLVNMTTYGEQYASSINGLSNGGFVVSWTDVGDIGDGRSIKARMFDADGNAVSDEFLFNTVTAEDQYESVVTGLSNGGFVVSWTDYSHVGGDDDVTAMKAKIFNANGSVVTDEFLVNNHTQDAQHFGAITALENGGFVITWTDNLGDASAAGIRAQVYTATGVEVGDEFIVNTTQTDQQYNPSVAALVGGGFVIAWDDPHGGSDDALGAIRAQVFDDHGNKLGGEFRANSVVRFGQNTPSVSALKNGDFVITWTDSSTLTGDTDQAGIVARIFHVSDGSNQPPAEPTMTGGTVAENAAIETVVATFAATDPDSGDVLTFTLTDDADGLFKLSGNTLLTAKSIDYEKIQSDAVTLSVSDGTDAVAKTFTINVSDIDEAPTMPSLSGTGRVAENAATNSLVGTFTASDPESKGLSYTLTDDAGGLFKLSGNKLVVAASADYEKVQNDTIEVEVSDGVNSVFRTFTIGITDVMETIRGSDRSQVLKGGIGADRIEALGGTDTLYGYAGDDRLYGGAANDTLVGGTGSDRLDGGTGVDTASYAGASKGVTASLIRSSINTVDAKGDSYVSIENLTGTAHADKLYGNTSANVLNGGAGNDLMTGGKGVDRLYGGSGADTFVFATSDSGKTKATADTIYDFTSTDTINLTGWDADSNKAGTQDFEFIGTKGFARHAGELRFETAASDTWIYGDTNGDGKADFIIHLDDAVILKPGYLDL